MLELHVLKNQAQAFSPPAETTNINIQLISYFFLKWENQIFYIVHVVFIS